MGKADTLALARTMLRASRQFADYNFRECVAARLLRSWRRAARLRPAPP
jgi:hypothetical protein